MAVNVKRKHHKKLRLNRSAGGNIAINVMLCFMGLFMVLPMVYAISNSLKPLSELWIYPPQFFVKNPTFSNFRDLFNMMSDSWVPFGRYLANTIFISVVGTAGHVIISSLCAYAFAKHDFPGREIMFKMVVLLQKTMYTVSILTWRCYDVSGKNDLQASHTSGSFAGKVCGYA